MSDIALAAALAFFGGAGMGAAATLFVATSRKRVRTESADILQPLPLKQSTPMTANVYVDTPDRLHDRELQLEVDRAAELQRDNRHADAIARLRDALEAATHDADRSILNRRIGNSLWAISQVEPAKVHYDEAVKFARLEGQDQDQLALGSALGNRGLVYLRLSDLESAERDLKEAQGIHQQSGHHLGHRAGLASALGGLGELDVYRGDLEEGKDYLQRTLAIYQEIDLPIGKADILVNLSDIHRRERRIELAEPQCKEALDINRKIGNRLGEAHVLGILGNVFRDKSKLDLAEECHKDALKIQREIVDRSGEATSLCNLGKVYRRRGDFQRAEKHHNEALRICREIPDRVGEANALGNLGNVCLDLREFDRARAYYEEALTIYREIGNGPGECYNTAALAGLAHLAARAKKEDPREAGRLYGEARERYEQAVEICGRFRSLEAARSLQEMHAQITVIEAEIARSAGELREARRLCRQALELCERADFPENHRCYVEIGRLLREIDDDMKAEASRLMIGAEAARSAEELEKAWNRYKEAKDLYEYLDTTWSRERATEIKKWLIEIDNEILARSAGKPG